MNLREMTREEMDEHSKKIGIPHPYKIKEMGICHVPSLAYVALWLIEDDVVMNMGKKSV